MRHSRDRMRLNVAGGLPIACGIVGRSGEISWPLPTRPGDVLHVESEVVAVVPRRSKNDGESQKN